MQVKDDKTEAKSRLIGPSSEMFAGDIAVFFKLQFVHTGKLC